MHIQYILYILLLNFFIIFFNNLTASFKEELGKRTHTLTKKGVYTVCTPAYNTFIKFLVLYRVLLVEHFNF